MFELFFKGKPAKKRKITQKSDDQIEKALDRKHKNWAREKLLERAKQDPSFEVQYISKLMGFEITRPDPSEKSKQELNDVISKVAIEEIKSDPNLVKQLARKRISETVGDLTGEESENTEYESRDPIEEVLERLEQDKRLKEELGMSEGSGGTGLFIKSILDSEFGKTLAEGFVALMVAARQQPQPNTQVNEKVYVVQIDGQMREVTETEYKKLLSNHAIKPLGLVEAPKEEPKQEIPVIYEHELPELPEFVTDDKIQLIASYLEMSPEEAVSQLESQTIDSTNEEAQTLWNIISNLNYDQISEFVVQYINHSKVGHLVDKILSLEGKIWIEKVINLVKEKSNG